MKSVLKPMLIKIGDESDLKREGYIFEPKLDGIRALCYVNKEMKFFSRNGLDLTKDYPELLAFRKNIKAKNCILDGEIVSYDERGNTSFEKLAAGGKAYYVVFDILMYNNKSLIKLPLIKRKEYLEKCVVDGNLLEKIFFTEDGVALFNEMKKRKAEGVIAKKFDSSYFPGKRTSVWLKVKLFRTIDCVVVGFTQKKRAMSSLALGLYDSKKHLTYIGRVGTGFSESFIEEISEKLSSLITKSGLPIPKNIKNIFWVKPVLVCEVKYLEFTKAKILRSPVFLRLRFDKTPKECTFKSQI